VTPKERLLDDLERWLTYFLTEEIASNADSAEIEIAIRGFLREEASKYDAKELAKLLDPPDRAVSLFLEYLKSMGLSDKVKGLWH
jgi:hypothetical protein